jgi:sialic acid synthase SpsE
MDRRLPGPDHAASLEPDELARMVAGIRAVERSLGSPRKQALATELGTRAAARRSLVAARPIAKGEVIGEDALEAKRPGTGLSPMLHWRTLGRTAVRSFEPDEPIEW